MTTRQQTPDWVGGSSPSHNRPLVPRVERLARGVRAIAAQIEASVDVPFADLYAPTRDGLGFTLPPSDVAHRAGWALVGEWLVATAVDAACTARGLAAVHEWFWAGSGRPVGSIPDVPMVLDVTVAGEVRALMPYLLDPMAAATRRDVLRAQSTAAERKTRKAAGVYYTPGDVAHMMVRRTMVADRAASRLRWLDPAHGSGVFLRAVLSTTYGEPDARDALYGVDLNPMAAETTAFVLTAEDIVLSPEGPEPWERWHRFRRNLATGDALLIDASQIHDAPRESENRSVVPQGGWPNGKTEPWRIESAFPEVAGSGFQRVVVNPPYAPLAATASALHVARLHPIAGPTANRDVSPVFVELCTEILSDDGAMAAVTPLSVVSSTRAPFPALREHLVAQTGAVEFLSFDRAPDALFGDDIKTRNAIVHLDRTAPSDTTASPLHRWTSRTRGSAIAKLPTVSVAALDGVPIVIPKIGFGWERELYIACTNKRLAFLDDWVAERRLMPLGEVTKAISDEPAIALAPTAYNFLSVARDAYRAVADGHDSQNSYLVMSFASEAHASAAYALLSSRVAFWIWHVTGDGFHVTGALPARVPVPPSDDIDLDRLAGMGDRLWKAVLQYPFFSVNRGRTSVAYPTWTHPELVNEIDAEVESFLDVNCAKTLATWYEQLVVVDAESERRNLIRRKTQ